MVNFNLKLLFRPSAAPNRGRKPAEWEELLEDASEYLTTLINDTEPEFLKIGEELQRFFGNASELLKKANEATLSSDGRNIQDILDQVRSIFDDALKRLNTISHAMSQSLASIFSSDVIEENNNLPDAQKTLIKQSKITEIIWTLIKINSGSLSKGGSNFVALVEQLGELSNRTRTNAEKLSEQVKKNQEVFCEIERSLNEWIKREKEEGEKLSKTIEGALELLSKAPSKLIGLSKRVQERSVHIEKHLGEIVSAIQFQDITRQRIEHVQESIRTIQHKIAQGEFRENGSLSWVYTTAKIQVSQLEQVAESISTAGKQLKENLQKIAGDCKEQSDDVGNVFGMSEEGLKAGVLDKLQSHTRSLREFFKQSIAMNSELLDTVRKISETTTVMRDSLNDIKKTHMDMTIVAMNAQIGSATLGEKGRPLSVLAEEITRLSKMSDKITGTATNSIKRILSFMNHLDSSLTESLNQDKEKTEEISKNAREALSLLTDAEARVKNAVNELGQESSDLAEQIMATVESIRFVDTTQYYIDRAIKKFNDLIAAIQIYQPKVKQEKFPTDIDLTINTTHYTMEAERNVHEETLGLADKGNKTSKTSETEKTLFVEQSNDDELGDNVELF